MVLFTHVAIAGKAELCWVYSEAGLGGCEAPLCVYLMLSPLGQQPAGAASLRLGFLSFPAQMSMGTAPAHKSLQLPHRCYDRMLESLCYSNAWLPRSVP